MSKLVVDVTDGCVTDSKTEKYLCSWPVLIISATASNHGVPCLLLSTFSRTIYEKSVSTYCL